MDPKELGCNFEDRNQFSLDRVQWLACCCGHGNEPPASIKPGNFSTNYETFNPCRKFLKHGFGGGRGGGCSKSYGAYTLFILLSLLSVYPSVSICLSVYPSTGMAVCLCICVSPPNFRLEIYEIALLSVSVFPLIFSFSMRSVSYKKKVSH
jgi:hypothetical protein